VKFIQAHQMAKNTWKNGASSASTCPAAMAWPSCAVRPAIATTNVRSNNSSSGLDTRCGSSVARAVIRTRIRLPGAPASCVIRAA
jgi:hypothetical protein